MNGHDHAPAESLANEQVEPLANAKGCYGMGDEEDVAPGEDQELKEEEEAESVDDNQPMVEKEAATTEDVQPIALENNQIAISALISMNLDVATDTNVMRASNDVTMDDDTNAITTIAPAPASAYAPEPAPAPVTAHDNHIALTIENEIALMKGQVLDQQITETSEDQIETETSEGQTSEGQMESTKVKIKDLSLTHERVASTIDHSSTEIVMTASSNDNSLMTSPVKVMTSPAKVITSSPPLKILRIRRPGEPADMPTSDSAKSDLESSPKRARARQRTKSQDKTPLITAPPIERTEKRRSRGRARKDDDMIYDEDLSDDDDLSLVTRVKKKKDDANSSFEKSFEELEREIFEKKPEPEIKKKRNDKDKREKKKEADDGKKRGRPTKRDGIKEEKDVIPTKDKIKETNDKMKETKQKVKEQKVKEQKVKETKEKTKEQKEKVKSIKTPEKRLKEKEVEEDEILKSFVDIEKDAFEKPVVESTVKGSQQPLQGVEEESAYIVGHLVWSRVSGHPWWPAMVSYDPTKGTYFCTKGRGQKFYHVQYFGPAPERGWISEKSTLTYLGLDGFEDALLREKKEKFKITPKRMPDWEFAIEEADEAVKMTIQERKQNVTFIYEAPKKSQKNSELKAKKVQAKVPHTPKKRRRCSLNQVEEKLNESPKSDASDPAVSSDFDAFVSAKIGQIREENPKLALDELQELLVETWDNMPAKERRKYAVPEDTEITIKEDTDSSKASGKTKPEDNQDDGTEDEKRFPGKCKSCGVVGHYKKTCPQLQSDDKSTKTCPTCGLSGGHGRKKCPKGDGHETAGEEETPVAPSRKRKPRESLADEPEVPVNNRKRKQRDSSAGVTEDSDVPANKRARHSSTGPTGGEPAGKSKKEKDSEESDIAEKKKKRKSPLTIDEEQALELSKLSSSGPQKKELVCSLCEKAGRSEEIVQCTGQCLDSFHVACLGVVKVQDGFKCDRCTSGQHICFVCKDTGTDLQKCSVVMCGKFYHDDCVKTFRQTRIHKSFICPLHCCSSCFVENPTGLKAFKGRLVKCLRCPSAYHTGDFCAGAGSEHVAGFYIICPKHFRPKKDRSHHAHVNVSWCFQCSKGGMLICCEGCPAAYHSECLEGPVPRGTWWCPDCMRGQEPMYGEIVWVKLGNYRWWPAEICHPKNVPNNVQDIMHQAGEFPVRFFGSRDYYWTHRGRIFLFQEGDKGSNDHSNASRSFANLFRTAVEEATLSYQLWRKTKTEKEQQASDKKPAPFKFIKTCVAVGNVPVSKADSSTMSKCECQPDMDRPCGLDSDCVNRMLLYECSPSMCPGGIKCENQRFQLRQYPEQSVFKTAKHGWGLKTLVDLKKGDFVNEYVGEVIDDEECKRRIKKAHEDNVTNFYMLTIEKDRIIDAGPRGNYSRFMNHSCNPNCDTQKWTINGEVRVGLFSRQDVPAGTELTFNYNFECLGDDKTACECGADNCSGFVGVRPKPTNGNVQKQTGDKNKKKKKRRKPKVKDGHEDECYRCGDGGDLVLCDKATCPKSYHLKCLSLEKMPHGKWDCPWHHCDDCGVKATKFCDECPNSFCTEHSTQDNIVQVSSRVLCTDHEDMIETLKSGKELPPDSDSSSVSSDVKDASAATNGASRNSGPANVAILPKDLNPKKGLLATALAPIKTLIIPARPMKRTNNTLLSRHVDKKTTNKTEKQDSAKKDKETPKRTNNKPSPIKVSGLVKIKPKTPQNPQKTKAKVESKDENETEDDASGIPGFKFKTTARRQMQKMKNPGKGKRSTQKSPIVGSRRKRARLSDKNEAENDQLTDLVIDA